MKKRFLLFSFILSLVFLTGCGIKLTSTMKLNTNFSGTRTMSCSIRISDLKNNFDGNADDIEKIIQESCPKSLSYKTKKSNNIYVYTFYLNFSSKEDYTEKVSELLNFSPKITYRYSSSPFVNGVKYKENFTSKDLMAWLFNAFYEKGYVDKEHSDDLWDLKETKFYFAKNSYDVEDKISVNTIAYTKVDSINIQTTRKHNNTFTRDITFNFPEDTLEKKRGAIESYFNIAHCKTAWTNLKNGKSLHVTFSADTFTDLCAISRKVLHSNDAYGKSKLKKQNDSPFHFKETFEENLDFKNFVDKSNHISSTYTVTANGKTKQLNKSTSPTPKISFTRKHLVKIHSFDLTSIYQTKDNLQLLYKFYLPKDTSKRDVQKIISSFHDSSFVSTKKSSDKDRTLLTVIQKGSVEKCNMGLQSVFSENSIVLDSSRSIFRGNKETLDFSFSLGESYQNVKGEFHFISMSDAETSDLIFNKKHYKNQKKNTHLIHKEYIDYIDSDATIQSIDSYHITSSKFDFSYVGSNTTDYWVNILRIMIPLGFLLMIGLFIYKKQEVIILHLTKLKEWVEKKME